MDWPGSAALRANSMDALGLLGSLGSLSTLIPGLKFAGTYASFNANTEWLSISTSTWKFGIASVYVTNSWSSLYGNGAVDTVPTNTILIAPSVEAHPAIYGVTENIVFSANTIKTYRAGFTALLFNY